MTVHELTECDQLDRPRWLPPETWPYALRVVDVDGCRVHCTDVGQGPTLLFVTAGMWSFVWRDVLARLESRYRCVALDFPGSGLSPRPHGYAPTLAGLSETLERFVDRLDLQRFTLVGHDVGGPVGLALAARRSALVEGLVLPQAFGWQPDGAALRAMLATVSSPLVRELSVASNLLFRAASTRFGVGRNYRRPDRRAFRGPFHDRGPRRAFHELMASARRSESLFETIEEATHTTLSGLPVLTIFGQWNDPFGFQARWRELYPSCRQVVVPRGNHFPMCDAPDLFAAALAEWHEQNVRVMDRTKRPRAPATPGADDSSSRREVRNGARGLVTRSEGPDRRCWRRGGA